MWTDDPLHDFAVRDAELDVELQKLPRCSECDEHIQSEYAFYINDEWICENCMDSYRKEVQPEW